MLNRKVDFFRKICEKSRIDHSILDKFMYSIDTKIRTIPRDYHYTPIGNLTIHYAKLLNEGLMGIEEEIIEKLNDKNLDNSETSFLNCLLNTLESITVLKDRQLHHLRQLQEKNPENKGKDPENKNIRRLIEIFSHIPLHPARTLEEALQTVLFINSLIWMDGHSLVGLGRLDNVLYPFLEKDLSTGLLGLDEAKDLIIGFLRSLNKYYEYKSNALLGDTGQVIVLGGKNPDGTDSTNPLTLIFMEALKDLRLPDPKIVLRVHDNTPEEVWDMALRCLEAGLGYPLFTNDEVIINSLINFGYREEDSFDYATSACWEPFIPGKSLDQNNLTDINFLTPLMRLLKSVHEEKGNISEFKRFLGSYKIYLAEYIEEVVESVDKVDFEPAPLLSLLVDDCIVECKDISQGGAIYNYYGLLSVGMGNTINALLNIKRMVYDEERIDLKGVYKVLEGNFESDEKLRYELSNKGFKYGMDEDLVMDLTNELINSVQLSLDNFRNKFGFKYKFGLSSPGFITNSLYFPASFDGRSHGEPFGVHISPVDNYNISYTAISNFASALNYDKAFNGGVVDIIAEKSFIKSIKDKFIDYLKVSFKEGVMQLQINVLNPEILIKAKEDPDSFPNLIVRVWGFSAYFKDLPEEYQDLIIKRALQYESQNHQYTTI